ncbi:HAD family hydrolase [Streptomyces puniciscabiei]|uniref:HAD family hydrolase n=1 Tax=Streptomyces puniciscabiei TaxID=164348 RepID=UPI000AF69F4D|nr:HAD family hydrolase [Streptomyces puniciscabiei]
MDAAHVRGLALPAAEDFASTPGVGVTATVDGRKVAVGSPARLLSGTEGAHTAVAAELEDGGRTAVLVVVDGTPAGVLGISDQLRPDAADTVASLVSLAGTPPTPATGDNPRAAARLAADRRPRRPAPAGQGRPRSGNRSRPAARSCMGDGVNAAPALASAHTGIAMGRTGSDLALETADAVIARDDLATVPAVVTLSRRARRLVVQNLVIAAVFISGLVV